MIDEANLQHVLPNTLIPAMQFYYCIFLRKALEDQLSLMEESLNNIGNSELQEELTDLLTEARSSVDTFRRSFMVCSL